MRLHLAYLGLASTGVATAAILLAVLLEPTLAGVTLSPIMRTFLMSGALSLVGGSAVVLFAWARYAIGSPDQDATG
jgi:hypothetical protein